MIKYRIFGSNEEYIDAIGEYVYISVHIRGTSVNFQKEGGFILSIDNLQNEYKFIDDDDKEVMPSFRNDFTSIRCESIDECIEKLAAFLNISGDTVTETETKIKYQSYSVDELENVNKVGPKLSNQEKSIIKKINKL